MATEVAVQTPYPGLRPFREDEACYFFGQDTPLDDLRNRLYEEHFVAILGLSGCGKSSLLKAGLLADIRPKQIRGPRSRWLIGKMKPGGDPLGGLINAVADVNSQIRAQKERLKEDLSAVPVDVSAGLLVDGYGLARYGHEAPLANGQDILIVVDQFEELFRYQREAATHREKDRAALFVQLLLQAAQDKECRVSVVITMRSEFLGDCALFFGLAEQVNQGTFLLPRMTRDQIEEVITGPAEEGGFTIDPKVVQELLNETEKQDDGLPLLQHALRRIHRHWLERGGKGSISAVDLTWFHGVAPEGTLLIKHHLDDHLDSIYGSLNEGQKIAAKLLFRLLSERDSRGRVTRRPLLFSDIVRYCGPEREEDLKKVIDAFRYEELGRTFLTPGWPDRFETAVVDISHECLLRRWDRLRKWINYEQYDVEQFCRLADDTDKADLHVRATGQERKAIEGAGLDNFLEWRSKAKLVGAGWALRYQGEYNEKLGRPQRCFSAAEEYLNWSAGRAREKAEKERKAAERLIRTEEGAKQARIEALLAQATNRAERRRRYAIIVGLVSVMLVAAGITWGTFRETKLRAAAEQSRLTDQAARELDKRKYAEATAQEAKENAKEQTRLKEDQFKTNGQLRNAVRELGKARDELQQKTDNLTKLNDQLTVASNDLKNAYTMLEATNVDLKKQTDAANKSNQAALDEAARAKLALEQVQSLQLQLRTQSQWLEALVLAGEAFSSSYRLQPDGRGNVRSPAERRGGVLNALALLESTTSQLGDEAEIKELYDVRKSGLRALADGIVPELAVTSLVTGTGEGSCYAEETNKVVSLLRSGRLRRQEDASAYSFLGSRRAGGNLFDWALAGVLRITRNSLYPRRDDEANALTLSDDCRIVLIGSKTGLIDQYEPRRNVAGYLYPTAEPLHQRGRVEMLRVSPNGEYAVASFAARGWNAWSLSTRRLIPGEQDKELSVTSAAFSPDNRWLLIENSNGRTFRFDLRSSSPNSTKTPLTCCNPVAKVRQQADVSNEGIVASFGASTAVVEYGTPGPIAKYERAGGLELRAVRLSPDGKLIAAGRSDGSVDIWNAGSPATPPTHLPDQTLSAVSTLSWSKSGKFLTVLHDSGTVRVWQLTGNKSSIMIEQVRDLLRRIEVQAGAERPGDTRALSAEVQKLLGR